MTSLELVRSLLGHYLAIFMFGYCWGLLYRATKQFLEKALS